VEGGARVMFPRPGPSPRSRNKRGEGGDVMLILRSFFACVSFCFIGYGRIETVGSSDRRQVGSSWVCVSYRGRWRIIAALYEHYTTLALRNMASTQGRDDDIAMIVRLRCLWRNSGNSVVVINSHLDFVRLSHLRATDFSLYKNSILVRDCRLRLLIDVAIHRCCHDDLFDL
jgi:hypothetical protein